MGAGQGGAQLRLVGDPALAFFTVELRAALSVSRFSVRERRHGMLPTATACAAPRAVICSPSCRSGSDATPVGSPTVPTMQPALAQLAGPPASALASASSTTRLAPTKRSGVVVSFTGAPVGFAIR